MNWFYAKELTSGFFEFDADESKHCVRVLRLKSGDLVQLTNGFGILFQGVIIDDNPKKCVVKIGELIKTEPINKSYLHLAVAPTKNIARFEWFIEKAAEIGVNEITPLQCDHSERIVIKPERFEKIQIAAIKQSQQTWLPKFNPITRFSNLINSNQSGQKFIAFVDEKQKQTLKSAYLPGSDALILIGPEGDFSANEIKSAIAAGFAPISLGKNRLRTETAALVAVHTISLINQ